MRLSERWIRALPWAVLACALLLVDLTRPTLVAQFQAVKRRHDAVLLPAPEVTKLMSLGYRAALADLVFAHVLVSYGIHFQEKRLFELAPHYLDVITALDPKFREPYRLADTLITIQPAPPPKKAYYEARRVQEKGLQHFPYDTELWLVSGQYLAFLAAPQLPPAEAEAFRLEGARRLARSCELVGSNENIPYHCITAASLFNAAGQSQAARGFLERVLAVTDDPDIEGLAGGYLAHLVGQAERDRAQERTSLFRTQWQNDLPFVSKERLLLLGPRFDSGACAGRPSRVGAECATSFRAWGESVE